MSDLNLNAHRLFILSMPSCIAFCMQYTEQSNKTYKFFAFLLRHEATTVGLVKIVRNFISTDTLIYTRLQISIVHIIVYLQITSFTSKHSVVTKLTSLPHSDQQQRLTFISF